MSALPSERTVRDRMSDLVYESCLLLNDQDWHGFLNLCEPGEFRYGISNYCPEIRKDQWWMDRDYEGLKHVFDLLPRHNSDNSPLTRQPTICRFVLDESGQQAEITTMVTIYRTQLDGVNSPFESGLTHVYAVGRYLDTVRLIDGTPKLVRREVRLDTRQLDIGSHFIF